MLSRNKISKLNHIPWSCLYWVAFILLFLIIGDVGRDPWWKLGEAYGFGIIYNFYTSHTWLIPNNAGIPFMEKPPLYYWTAVLFCDAFKNLLSLADAARLASCFYMGVSCIFLWKAARIFYREYAERKTLQWICIILLVSSYGIVNSSHEMVTDVALLAGTTIALYGMALLNAKPSKWAWAGAWFGAGIGIAFLSKGLFMLVVFGISCGILLGLIPDMRRRTTFYGCLAALLMASPFLFLWPLCLYQYSPAYFYTWLWDNNIGRFLGHSVDQLGAKNERGTFFLRMLSFTFPVLPLTCIESYIGRTAWRRPEFLIPAVISLVGLLLLFCSASCRPVYLMPLIPGLALVASPGLTRLSSRFFRLWNGAARIVFTIAGAFCWVIWWNLRYPPHHRPLPWLERYYASGLSADFVFSGEQGVALFFAVIVTGFWAFTWRLNKDTALNTSRIWLAGAALIWCTCYTLFLPWMNDVRSFRAGVERFQNHFNTMPYAGKCIGNYRLGENMAPMLEYFMKQTSPLPPMDFGNSPCSLFLTFALLEQPTDMDARWHMVWHGGGFLDIKSNELRLYLRN